jgi:hypothetical protein
VRRALFFVAFGLISSASLAQEITAVSLEDALVGATSIAALDGHTLVVAGGAGSFICDIAIDPNFFPSIREGMAEAAAHYAPNATCVASSAIKSAGKN